ncbi:hypothetical protein AC249_AIPGENE3368 [Exaiptasia diaphana]|nr:hypothetical protein AC249_AIPGENE3368 [Exaiptasia diaphana]
MEQFGYEHESAENAETLYGRPQTAHSNKQGQRELVCQANEEKTARAINKLVSNRDQSESQTLSHTEHNQEISKAFSRAL